MHENPCVKLNTINSCYSCLLLKTYVKRPIFKGQYAWVDKKYNSTHQRLNKEYPNNINIFWFDIWLSGITDGSGTFSIVRQNNQWHLFFQITQSKYNIRLLYYIKKELKAGSVIKDNLKAKFFIRDRNILKNIIFPKFDKYPLLTSKKFNYDKFKEGFFILEDNNLTQDEKDRKLFQIKDKISSARVNTLSSTCNMDSFKGINDIKNVITKPWLVGFIEAKGRFYIVSSNSSRIYNGFSLIQKLDVIVLEAIRSIFHISTKVKYISEHDHYILDTTNSRGIQNIINYLQGKMKGMKSLSFKLWRRASIRKDNLKKISKIQTILHRTESNLNYPFTLKRKFSSTAAFSSLYRDYGNIPLNPFYITGFCDAESSFIISLSKRPDSRVGWSVRAHFQIVLHSSPRGGERSSPPRSLVPGPPGSGKTWARPRQGAGYAGPPGD